MMKHALILLSAFLVALGLVRSSSADAISKNCSHHENIVEIPSPVEKNIIDIKSKQNPNEIRSVVNFGGEPVSAGAWLLIYVNKGEPNADCFLLHSGEANSSDLPGFNEVLLQHAFYRENSKDGRIELFVPVTAYPHPQDEDHSARLVEINIGKDGIPKVIK